MSDNENSTPTPDDLAAQAFADAERKKGEKLRVAYDREKEPWRGWLQWSKRDGLRPIEGNAMLVLEHHGLWNGLIAYDEFSNRILKLRAPPFQAGEAGDWTDSDTSMLSQWLAINEQLYVSDHVLDRAVRAIAKLNRYHQVRQWLESLPPWDEEARCEYWLSDVFGCPKDEYHAHVGTGLLVALVARSMDPGCKVDDMVVFEGPQGIGKSTALIELVGLEWHADVIEAPGHKDFPISLQGKLLVEIGELQSFTKAEVRAVKQACSARVDRYRTPFARAAEDHPRQCVFVGTTNDDQYLTDPTGGRRFLPVRCTQVNLEYIRANKEQLFAEAVVMYRRGFEWWGYPLEQARELQELRYVQDSWEPLFERFANIPDPHEMTDGVWRDELGYPVKCLLAAFLAKAVGLEHARQDKSTQMRGAAILKRMGWRQVRLSAGGRSRVYVRPAEWQPPPPPGRDAEDPGPS